MDFYLQKTKMTVKKKKSPVAHIKVFHLVISLPRGPSKFNLARQMFYIFPHITRSTKSLSIPGLDRYIERSTGYLTLHALILEDMFESNHKLR